MRPPWSETAALLAFTPAAMAAPPRRNVPYRRPAMSDDIRYALFRKLDGFAKPTAAPDLHALARMIERERGEQAIQLVEIEDFEFAGDRLMHTAVEVWTLDMAGDRDNRIGVAWLNEDGRDRLEPALRAVRMNRPRAERRRAA